MGGESRLRVEVLGPIRVCNGAGQDVTPDGSLQRRLLALLVLHRGRVVSPDAAIEALWPGRPPRDPIGALQTHLSRLRRSLPAGLVESTAEGYRISPTQLDVDSDQLTDAVHRCIDIDDVDALTTIDEILERWQGPAYPELADVDAGRTEAIGLAELRSRAAAARAERRLAAGATDGLVAELMALADEEPLRERPRELLMSALAATGRHAEALRVYDDFRRHLADELGIAPSPALSALQAELLGVDVAPRKLERRLPLTVTSLEGRTATMEEILALAGNRRLLTLIGPGGVGKTRLLIETGHRLQAARSERPVVMCELAAASVESAVDVVAAALAIDRRAGELLAERVVAVLGETEVVLLLDNCEHVLDPIADLADRLLVGCPNVSMIATSHERLRVAGEQLFVVPPLPTSDEDGPAVHLFVERARAVNPQFDPEPAERVSVTEIVRRLDGLPLAIELAAARLRTLDVNEIAAGLDRRFELLSAGARTSTCHGSLAAVVSWSYELLEVELRRSYADLSVFAGAFTVEDAAAICHIDIRRAATVLDQLAERSLVVPTGGRQFTLLETLRAFGVERLLEEGRAEEVSARHVWYFVEWIEGSERRLLTSERVIADIDAALPELRRAFGWLIDHDAVEFAGRLVVALVNYGVMRLRPEVLVWAERVVAGDADDRSPMAAWVWAIASYAAWMAGDVTEAGVRSARAERVAERIGDLPTIVCMVRGNHALFEGKLADAVAWYRRADAAAQDTDEVLMSRATELLALSYAGDVTASQKAAALLTDVGELRTARAAYVWYCAGEAELGFDVELALQRLARAVEMAELTGASFVVGIAGTSKASIEARLGDPHLAAEEYRRLITHWRRAGMWSTQWTMLRSIAGLLTRLGRPREAALLTGSVLATQAGHRIFGEDAASLAELGQRLRDALGDEAYETLLSEGAQLDGDAAVELALLALR